MKYKKGLALLLVCFALIGTTWLTASATASKPYGSYSTTISSSLATARISKCSCNPVNNYLMAAIQVQYKSGDNYYWYPSSSSYVYSEGSNTTGVSKTVNESNITYAKGWFKARCGTGSTKSFYRTATK